MAGIDTTAPVISRHETLVDAPLRTVWELQTGIGDWPTWNPDIESVTVDGPLEAGLTFDWRTHGLDIHSTVQEVDAPHRIVWGGPSGGITGVHVWTFTERPDGVLVHTEESWDGEPIRANVDAMQAALDASLVAWLGHLRTAATGSTR
ncbi:SRPBCC family protein [Actinoallomurus sp. CA-150999]|uniref:SRPBCC family protein n=1 Tax=Actinoallomurus sp. CA-150999 TaxID=3239887 RepID=UPI003D8C7A9E